MPRWAIVLTVVPLALCLGCAAFGYVVVWRNLREEVVPEIQGNVAGEMAAALSSSVSNRIEARALGEGGIAGVDEVVLRAADLDVNTMAVPGGVGVETGPDGTQVYGVETRVGPGGITVIFPGVMYSAVPVVADGRVELTRIDAGENPLGFLLPEEVFEAAIEGGIADALGDHGLRPLSLSLRPGAMTIRVEPIPCLGGVGGLDGCDSATPRPRAAR